MRSETIKRELHTRILEHVSASNLTFPVSGRSGTVPIPKSKGETFANYISHMKKHHWNLRRKDLNCSDPPQIQGCKDTADRKMAPSAAFTNGLLP